jgi:glutamate carboxypeptidase
VSLGLCGEISLMKQRLLVLFCLLVCYPVFADSLSPTEKKISEYAKAHTPEAIALIEQTVNINSGTMNPEGVRQVGDIYRKEFDALKFQTSWSTMPADMDRAGHLIAEHKGTQGKRLLLIGHLDTVFEKDTPFHPFTRTGSRATGQGVNDMKGGDVIVIYALKALQSVGALDKTQIIVVFDGDEEDAGSPLEVSRKDVIDSAKRSDIALAFEAAMGMTGTIARRGVSSWTLTLTGTQSHSSDIFTEKVGAGAVFEASRILNAFYDQLRGEKYLTFNPALILGGTEVTYDDEHSRGTAFGKTNVVAPTATVTGDIRTISVEQLEKVRERMRKIVEQSLPKTSAKIEFVDGYPGMAPSDGNMKLLKMLDQASRDLGYGEITALDPAARGAGDIAFVSGQVDCLDGLGASGNGGHTNDEDIDLDAMPMLIQRAAILIYRLTR